MNKGKAKSIVLFSLVLLSLILTTRIWFDTSIEGIFVMFRDSIKTPDKPITFDQAVLLRPESIYLNYSKHTSKLVTSFETGSGEVKFYDQVFDASTKALKSILANRIESNLKKVGADGWSELREERSIELELGYQIEMEHFLVFLGIDKNLWSEIKYVDAINISSDDKKIYVLDNSQKVYFEIDTTENAVELGRLLTNASETETLSLIDFHDINGELYSADVIVPIPEQTKMPVLAASKELNQTDESTKQIYSFFDDNATLSVIKNKDGSTDYTDREDTWLRIDNKGMLEVLYKVKPVENITTNLKSALETSAAFINRHMGFPYDAYISGIEQLSQSGKTNGYIIKYQYRYDNMPILGELNTNNNAIEIEIVNNQVKSFKRQVPLLQQKKNALGQNEEIAVISPDDALNPLFEYKDESVKLIKNMYIAYLEREIQGQILFTPVWVVDAVSVKVDANGNEKEVTKQYRIDMETKWIIDYQ